MEKNELLSADITRIAKMMPHRYPFLLVDRVVDIDLGRSATGIKNGTYNEPFFPGHFPGHPIMPGVLIVEAMAQTAGVLVLETLAMEKEKLVYFMSIDNVKFRRPVIPGDQLKMYVSVDRNRGNVWRFNAEAKVDGQTATEATFAAMIVDK